MTFARRRAGPAFRTKVYSDSGKFEMLKSSTVPHDTVTFSGTPNNYYDIDQHSNCLLLVQADDKTVICISISVPLAATFRQHHFKS